LGNKSKEDVELIKAMQAANEGSVGRGREREGERDRKRAEKGIREETKAGRQDVKRDRNRNKEIKKDKKHREKKCRRIQTGTNSFLLFQHTLYFLDPRPKANAVANTFRGGGYEAVGPRKKRERERET
jgi:hypothetical protein